MNLLGIVPALSAALALAASAADPFGVFDFDLRGDDPGAQIHSLDGIGFDGITTRLQHPKDLVRLEAYQKAKPDLKVFAALFNIDHTKPEEFDRDQLTKAVGMLAVHKAKVWLVMSGTKGSNDKVAALVREAADIAAAAKVGISLYPHHKCAVETAEEALMILKLADRPNLTISVHQCHELRLGNRDRLDAVMTAVQPYMDIVTICGSDRNTIYENREWSDAIKPLGEGDYDPKEFLRALKRHNFKGPIILHTFGLKNRPIEHYRNSFTIYQKMKSEVDSEQPTQTP